MLRLKQGVPLLGKVLSTQAPIKRHLYKSQISPVIRKLIFDKIGIIFHSIGVNYRKVKGSPVVKYWKLIKCVKTNKIVLKV